MALGRDGFSRKDLACKTGNPRISAEESSFFDVSVPRFGAGGDDPQGDEIILFPGKVDRGPKGSQKAPVAADVMIGGEDDHHASGVLPMNMDGRQTEAGGGISPHRFDQKVFFRDLGNFPAQIGQPGSGR